MEKIKQDENGKYVIPPDMIGIRSPEFEIQEVTKYEYYDVTTKHTIYRRFSKDNWEYIIGETWEPILYKEEIETLEKAFRDYFEKRHYNGFKR